MSLGEMWFICVCMGSCVASKNIFFFQTVCAVHITHHIMWSPPGGGLVCSRHCMYYTRVASVLYTLGTLVLPHAPLARAAVWLSFCHSPLHLRYPLERCVVNKRSQRLTLEWKKRRERDVHHARHHAIAVTDFEICNLLSILHTVSPQSYIYERCSCTDNLPQLSQ